MIGAEKASIQGTAKPAPVLDEPTLLIIAGRCGAVDPSFRNGMNDLMRVTSRSSKNDHNVVACVKRSVGTDFDAFIASGEPDDHASYDDAPFADLAAKS
jgi:hypothetical protein